MRFCYTIFIFLLGFSVPISRAGGIEQRGDTTVIHVTLFDLPDFSRTDTKTRADAAAVKEFIRRFPRIFAERYRDRYKANPEKYGEYNWDNVQIELESFSGIQVEGVENTLLAIAGKVAPDVLYVNFRMSYTYIEQGFLYPLDKPEDGYFSSMTKEERNFRINPKIWPVIHRKDSEGREHVWALPYGGALGKIFLYRKDLFDEAGIPYPENDWTWDDFYHICRNITDPSRGIYGIHFSRGKHESWWWLTFLWSAGGEAVRYDPELNRWEAAFDSRQAAVALDFYNKICSEAWVDDKGIKRHGYAHRSADWGSTSAKWERGEIAMLVAYIDERLFQRINPDVTGMVPVPVGPTGLRGAELNSMMMGLFAGIEEPAVRDAAWEYMRFYDGEEAMRIKTRIMVEGGLGRFINPRYLEMFGYPELVRLAPRGWAECFDIAIRTGRPEPYGKNCNYIYNIMTYPIEDAEELNIEEQLPENRQARLDVLQDLLTDAVDEANEELMGLLTPAQMAKRRTAAALVLLLIITAFVLGFRRIHSSFSKSAVASIPREFSRHMRRYVWGYMLLLPAILTILCWRYLPLLRGSIMAFQDYRIMGGSSWIGLDNFGNLLWDKEWWMAVWNAFRYSLFVVGLTFLPPIILAILLQEIPYGRMLFRSLYYLPAVMTGLVVILLWKSFYDPSERGVLNSLMMQIPAAGFLGLGLLAFTVALLFALRLFRHQSRFAGLLFLLGGTVLAGSLLWITGPIFMQDGGFSMRRIFATLPEPIRWLGDSSTAMLACVLPMAWAGMGPGCLIYLAALKSIPDDLYEAADIDGATFIDKILFVVFPFLKPLIIINFVGVFIGSWLYATPNILAMTGGAAGTEVAGLHIFYKAFLYLKFGPATAMAWVLGFLLIGFTVYQLRILSRVEFRAAGETK